MKATERDGRSGLQNAVTGAWIPDLKQWGKPHYLAIVEALAGDIRLGRLTPGTRLPTQRALAETLGLNFTTVSRGYVEAHKRGLIEGRVGQGTFVVDPARSVRSGGGTSGARVGPIDFTMNLPPEPDTPALRARMQASFAELSGDLANLLRYQGFGGTDEDKVAALRWLKGRGVDTRTALCSACSGRSPGEATRSAPNKSPTRVSARSRPIWGCASSICRWIGMALTRTPSRPPAPKSRRRRST
jgi:hypothetical protein